MEEGVGTQGDEAAAPPPPLEGETRSMISTRPQRAGQIRRKRRKRRNKRKGKGTKRPQGGHR